MSLSAIQGLTTTTPPSSTVPASSPGAASTARAPGMAFSDVVSNLLSETSAAQEKVGTEVGKLVNGESDNVHDVVLSVARADLAFRLVMEIRDQLITSYHEVMRMQV